MRPFATVLLGVALGSIPAPAPAQNTPADAGAVSAPTDARARFAGAPFVFVGGDPERRAIEAAIERAIQDMSFITRPMARDRLRAKNPAYATLRFGFPPGQIEVVVPGRAPFRSPDDGAAATWASPERELFTLTQRIVDASRVVQTVGTREGGRRNEYTLSPDGRSLTLRVTISSPQLPRPVVYALTYRR